MVDRWEKKKDVTERKTISKKIKERAEKCMCTATTEETKEKQVGSQFTGQSKSYVLSLVCFKAHVKIKCLIIKAFLSSGGPRIFF